jgi:hypothetical protein
LRSALAIVLGLAAAGTPGASRADDTDTTQRLSPHVGADSWLIVSASAAELEQLLPLAGLWDDAPRGALASASAVADRMFTSSEAARAAGTDAGAPQLLALREERRDGDLAQTARLVFLATDVTAARAALALRWKLPLLERASLAEVARLAVELGEPATRGPTIVRELRRAQIFLAGRAGEEWVFARSTDDGVIVIDEIDAGRPVRWGTDAERARVRTVGTGIGDLLRAPSGRLLARPGVSVWVDPALRAGAGDARRGPRTGCDGFLDLGARGPFDHAAARLHIAARSLEVELEWALRPAGGLAAALPTSDDGLRWQDDARAAIAIHTRDTRPLRALARPDALAGPWLDVQRRIAACGVEARWWAIAFGWPIAIASFLDAVAALDPSAADAVNGLRNVNLSLDSLSTDPERVVGTAEASVDGRAARALRRYLDAVFGAPRRIGRPQTHTRWGRGPIRPYVRDRAGGDAIVGAGLNGGDVARRLARHTPRAKPPTSIARLRVDVASAAADLGWNAIGKLVAARFGRTARGHLRVDGDALRATLTID